MSNKSATIIGGGPAGTFTGYCLAKKGFAVSLFEEHKKIGCPWQCTGILTHDIHALLQKHGLKLPQNVIDNKISSVAIVAPDKQELSLKFKHPDIILNRSAYDQFLYNKFLDAGGDGFLGHRFVSCDFSHGNINVKHDGKVKKISTQKIIGADGPQSLVAQKFDLLKKRRYFTSMQAVVKIKHDNVLRFYPFVGSFAWSVPSGDGLLRIGLCMPHHPGQQGQLLSTFQNLLELCTRHEKHRLISKQGGLIPYFSPLISLQRKKGMLTSYLVGDAATQVKSTTGGGIIPGMRSGALLSSCLTSGISYNLAFRFNRNNRELYAHHLVRRMMNNFRLRDWNDLIAKTNSPHVRKDLNTIGRDNLLRLGTSVFFHKPSLIKYFFKLF